MRALLSGNNLPVYFHVRRSTLPPESVCGGESGNAQRRSGFVAVWARVAAVIIAFFERPHVRPRVKP